MHCELFLKYSISFIKELLIYWVEVKMFAVNPLIDQTIFLIHLFDFIKIFIQLFEDVLVLSVKERAHFFLGIQ